MIRRFHEAKNANADKVVLWGTGSPKREFVFSDDITKACIKLLNSKLFDTDLPINIGVGHDISIKELSVKIANLVGYKGEITWDVSKPDGAPRKLLDNRKITSLGWEHEVQLDQGLEDTYRWYLNNLDNINN